MKMSDLYKSFETLCPISYAEGWDNPGLLAGRMDRNINKVYVSLDAGSESITEAAALGCDLIVTHHPLIFSPMKKINDLDFIGKRIVTIIENKMNYFAMHTNFDVAVMADLANDKLGFKKIRPLEITDTEKNIGIGSVGSLNEKMTLKELAMLVKETFELPDVRFYGNPDMEVTIAAICPGSGKSCDQGAYEAGAQVYITGDVDHHYGIDSVEKGLAVIDAGHHGLEHIYVDFMEAWFKNNHPELEVYSDKNKSPFNVV